MKEPDRDGVIRFDAHGSADTPPHKMLAAYLSRLHLTRVFDAALSARHSRGAAPGDDATCPLERAEGLRVLHRAHACSIPITSHRVGEASLKLQHLYRKLIQDRQAGTRFESSILFAWAVEQILGCQVDLLEASSALAGTFRTSDALKPFDHVCLVVHLSGQAWLADPTGASCHVSKGSYFPPCFSDPLMFEPGIEQVQDSGKYRIQPIARQSLEGKAVPSSTAAAAASSAQSRPGPSSAVLSISDGEGGGGSQEREGSSSSSSLLSFLEGARERVVTSHYGVECWVPGEVPPGGGGSGEGASGSSKEEKEGEWTVLCTLSTWPRSVQEFEEAGKKQGDSKRPVWGHVVAKGRRVEEGGGRVVLSDTELSVYSEEGLLEESVTVESREQYQSFMCTQFSIPTPSDEDRPLLPVARDSPCFERRRHDDSDTRLEAQWRVLKDMKGMDPREVEGSAERSKGVGEVSDAGNGEGSGLGEGESGVGVLHRGTEKSPRNRPRYVEGNVSDDYDNTGKKKNLSKMDEAGSVEMGSPWSWWRMATP